jgi:hypothetical protein
MIHQDGAPVEVSMITLRGLPVPFACISTYFAVQDEDDYADATKPDGKGGVGADRQIRA